MIYVAYDLVLPLTSPTPLASTLLMIEKGLQTGGYIIPVFILCLSLTAIITETQKTSIVIHQLIDTQKTHTRTRYELEQFSLELLHRDLSFSPCGLFSLNNSFLVSIAGTVITYVMILIQYDQSLAAVDENYWNDSIEISNDTMN
ncbi:hypothetical protein PV327_001121 [Microctonus hyperodae]|uniref:Gustatory receptor n=1 Tax=Microctonus hyperodae TaxID=165561 RepID=A0AA39G7X4_MICHY|nr:hypothetical protein PV327_001121 [Microctonus hyperodae]